jgi:hypothetical protein
MKKRTQSLWILGALATVLVAVPLFAQQSDTQSPISPSSQQQQQQDPGQAQPPANQNGNDS